ncbi:MAG TPA: protein-L-isoaspartate(D-aspartate) O-methyltransferase [Vicinamibacterales bacterium]|nr:protein-L-isoaspartate(D-aspartate) O-methyltransferase [Vicinamibacterales bacterium]
MDPRSRMVAEQIRARGVRDERVLDAMMRVPREQFVPPALQPAAYEDHPLEIGHGQTISQPYIVAYMTEALRLEPSHRVLEIGAGCGYQTAVLAELVREVFSVELLPDLADRARSTLAALGYTNVQLRTGDGYEGWPEHAPYDRILAAAAPVSVPPALLEQLVDGGIIALPIGTAYQELRVLQTRGASLETLATLPVRFVPMIKGGNTVTP